MTESTNQLGLVHHVSRNLHAAHTEHEGIHALELRQSRLHLVAWGLDLMEAEGLDLGTHDVDIHLDVVHRAPQASIRNRIRQ